MHACVHLCISLRYRVGGAREKKYGKSQQKGLQQGGIESGEMERAREGREERGESASYNLCHSKNDCLKSTAQHSNVPSLSFPCRSKLCISVL